MLTQQSLGSMLKPIVSREVRLVSHPRGWPAPDDFQVASTELAALSPGQMLVRNLYMSLDPYMHGRMSDVRSDLPAFRLGEALEGSAVGEIIASAAVGFAPGEAVTSMYGWREYFMASPSCVRRVDRSIRPLSAHLGVLGSTGLAAWAGVNLAKVRAHEQVFISRASGAVGSVTGQLAKLEGCYVSGSAESSEAALMLVRELGFDAAFNDKQNDLRRELEAAAPQGIDVYFDNVGGAHLELVLDAMRPGGRIVTSGELSRYNEPRQLQSAHNRELFVAKRLTMKAFRVSDWLGLAQVFKAAVGEHLRDGRISPKDTIIEGIERAPEAFIELVRGGSAGKVIVKLS
jgi:NADPH-dependent curcumin reductase CurA